MKNRAIDTSFQNQTTSNQTSSQSEQLYANAFPMTNSTLHALGMLRNQEPKQIFNFVGYQFNCLGEVVRLTTEKGQALNLKIKPSKSELLIQVNSSCLSKV